MKRSLATVTTDDPVPTRDEDKPMGNDNNNDDNNNNNNDDSSFRNKALAEIIRGGYHLLQQGATEIAQAAVTRKSIVGPTQRGPSPRQRAEEHLLYTTVTQCWQQLVNEYQKTNYHYHNNSAAMPHPLSVNGGEPIVILKVELKDSKLAILYWSLPFSILADHKGMTPRETQILEFRLHQQLTTNEEANVTCILQRRVHAALSHFYPPRLRFVPAPDHVLVPVLQDMLA